MIRVDTIFLVQHELLELNPQLAATLWTACVRHLLTSKPADFQIFGYHLHVT